MRQQERVLEEYTVLQAQAGVSGALEKLVELRGPKLLAHAMRLLSRQDDARDAVQEAWIEILRGLRGLREPRAFASWSTRIVTRRCARLISTKVKQREISKELWAERQIAPETLEHDNSQASIVRAAIAKLPPAQSATIALFYLEEMSIAEVSVALDIPRGTVKTRLMHARQKLKHALEGEIDE